jgi:predicted RNase H-like HicB family nuclease
VTGREEKIIKDDSSLKALHAWFKQSAEKQKTLEKVGNRVRVHWKEAPSFDASKIETTDYLAVIERDSNGKYRAHCPALKGVSVSANSFEVVKAKLQKKLERYLNELAECGETAPAQQAYIAMMSAKNLP